MAVRALNRGEPKRTGGNDMALTNSEKGKAFRAKRRTAKALAAVGELAIPASVPAQDSPFYVRLRDCARLESAGDLEDVGSFLGCLPADVAGRLATWFPATDERSTWAGFRAWCYRASKLASEAAG